MDSLNKANDLQALLKRLSWQLLDLKGVDNNGNRRPPSSNRRLEMENTTVGTHASKSPYPLTFRLTAQIPDAHFGHSNINDPSFLNALAEAITDKLPELMDDVLVILKNKSEEAFLAAEKELKYSQSRLEAIRPQLQRELIE